ncbi:MAG TPA: macro domain-containing protein [Ohtaekwangia sp.]|uniref:type II toxin-antitoxin system antitoxin DNA ADP-ribosyl glycohydrolase DarG n=1 Tax=Ohtaekwangia sp. TaxID=2066019 RepID=UPI002F944DB6
MNMIQYQTGNVLESPAEALVNTVNTVGIMGKGIALQFKKEFPLNTRKYEEACKNGAIDIGKLLVVRDASLATGNKVIINFPTKKDWRKPSEYSFIESGLKDLVRIIHQEKIKSIAIPPLGAGNGGLDWQKVKEILEKYLSSLPIEIYIYEPNVIIQEAMKKERIKLTPARAMLLDVLYDLVRNGEFVSEFAAEKIAYFLQRFGASDQFKLEYKPNFYGPYSGKVKYVLYYLNGSYIFGYSAMDKKPFEELGIVTDGAIAVKEYLSKPENQSFKTIANKTKEFLTGFYSSFALELLSTVDFIMKEKNVHTVEDIKKHLETWNDRKKTLFNNPKFIDVSVDRIQNYLGQNSEA